ncbi:MAG: 50S ribosomal protein L4 [Candidatus Roizmanbacteria bacterium]|nr:50S ribosomal protein L4 [Candidatus Roizmanbacteria bacterium]
MKKIITVPVLGAKDQSVTLSSDMFEVAWPAKLIAQYVRMIWANTKRNAGLTKTRSGVKGSTRKIYKQKGTGRARHGDIKAPIFVGGGVAHGVTNTKPKLIMPKKMRRKALFAALSRKRHDKKLFFISQTLFNKQTKTKDVLVSLQKHVDLSKTLFLVLPHNHESYKAFANIENIKTVYPSAVNAYRVMKYEKVIFTPESLNEFTQLFIKK